jgi:hypothetical protein
LAFAGGSIGALIFGPWRALPQSTSHIQSKVCAARNDELRRQIEAASTGLDPD